MVHMISYPRQPSPRRRKPLRVCRVAHHRGLLEPVRLKEPLLIQHVQVIRAPGVCRRRDLHAATGDRLGVGIDAQPLEQLDPSAMHAEQERLPSGVRQVGEDGGDR